jgi:hypothetical protein
MVSCIAGRIEDFHTDYATKYNSPCRFDVGIAFHACGAATDYSQLQCMRCKAAYVMCPCCVGKIKFSMHDLALKKEKKKMMMMMKGEGEGDGDGEEGKDGQGEGVSGCLKEQKEPLQQTAVSSSSSSSSEVGKGGTVTAIQCDGLPELTHPRSNWLRSLLPADGGGAQKFAELVQVADHSLYDFNDPESDWKRKCKTILEVDRNEAAREHGYTVQMFKLIEEQASPKNDVIVGVHRNKTVKRDEVCHK